MNPKIINFFMPMIPPTKTQQEKRITVRNGKPIVYEDAELKAVRQKLTDNLAKFIPSETATSAVRLMVKWIFPITGKHIDGEYKATKPDTDNLQKMLKDCMTTLKFWEDDCLVASEIIEKFYGKMPGIYIYIEDLTEDD